MNCVDKDDIFPFIMLFLNSNPLNAFAVNSVLFTALFFGLIATASDKECSIDAKECSFIGTLELHTYPGPPKYKDIKMGDEPETHLYMKLDQPMTVHFKDWDNNQAPVTEKLSLLQIGGDFEEKFFKVARKNNHAIIKGTLFEAFSGHHHTHFLIDSENGISLDKK